jgi:hypothetical protein
VKKNDIWLTVDYSEYERYKLRMRSYSKSVEERIAFNDSLSKMEDTQKKLSKGSVFTDSLRLVYPNELLLPELIALDLEKVPRTYQIIKMPRKEFETLKFTAIGKNSVLLPSLKHIIGSKYHVSVGTD